MPLSNNLNTRSVVNIETRGLANNVTQSSVAIRNGLTQAQIETGFSSGSASGSRQVLFNLTTPNGNSPDTFIGSVQLTETNFIIVYLANTNSQFQRGDIYVKGVTYQGFDTYYTSSEEQLYERSGGQGASYRGANIAVARQDDKTAVIYCHDVFDAGGTIAAPKMWFIKYDGGQNVSGHPTIYNSIKTSIAHEDRHTEDYLFNTHPQAFADTATRQQLRDAWMAMINNSNDEWAQNKIGSMRYRFSGSNSDSGRPEWELVGFDPNLRRIYGPGSTFLGRGKGILLGTSFDLLGNYGYASPLHLWVGHNLGNGTNENNIARPLNSGMVAHTTLQFYNNPNLLRFPYSFNMAHATYLGSRRRQGRFNSSADICLVDLGNVGNDETFRRNAAVFCIRSGASGFTSSPANSGKIYYNLIGINDKTGQRAGGSTWPNTGAHDDTLPLGFVTTSYFDPQSQDPSNPGLVLSGSMISDNEDINCRYRIDNNNVYSLRENYILLGATNYDSGSFVNEAWLIKHETGSKVLGTLTVVHTASISPKLSSNLSGSYNRRSIIAGSLVDDFAVSFNGISQDRYPTDTDFFFVNYNDQVSADHNSGSLTLGKLTIDYDAETITANITGSDCLVICDDQDFRTHTVESIQNNLSFQFPSFCDLYFHSASEASIIYRDMGNDSTDTTTDKPIVVQSIRIE